MISLVCLVPLAVLLYAFPSRTACLASMAPLLIIAAIVYVVIAGFLVAAVCGYMAGLIGSSNSPVSGLAILTVLGAALVLAAIGSGSGAALKPALIAYCAVRDRRRFVCRDDRQRQPAGPEDRPARRRHAVAAAGRAFVIGVVFGAIVIPPVLDLLHQGYGFPGEPHPIAPHGAVALSAPQATLISSLASGVIGGSLRWDLLGIGVLVGIAIIAIDETMRLRGWIRLPPLAVGIGIYLPAGVTSMVVVGAICGYYYNRWAKTARNPANATQLGVLLASGLIVGESLWGVVNSVLFVATRSASPLKPPFIGDAFLVPSQILGTVAFAIVTWWLYAWIRRLSSTAT